MEHLTLRIDAREAIGRGYFERAATSQLAILSDAELARGVQSVRAAIAEADARGETCWLEADLRLWATEASR